jgi:hypothetical protein
MEVVIMLKAMTTLFLSSLFFYGMGYSKVLIIRNAVTANTYDSYDISLATVYFVLAIFLAIIGSLLFYVKNNRGQEGIEIKAREGKIKPIKKPLAIYCDHENQRNDDDERIAYYRRVFNLRKRPFSEQNP